ncbi:hypothetical protein ARMGADRAFT_267401 [Armillaria gallica]|uniref:Uncharacterized protein n=1 Tax=Armillaria gallica TaxID=47427 RepID=A0A2H3E5G4_ARMGA|nr:hypothetical protein ARMGADRAFT_267401 [Armillaria gallica]
MIADATQISFEIDQLSIHLSSTELAYGNRQDTRVSLYSILLMFSVSAVGRDFIGSGAYFSCGVAIANDVSHDCGLFQILLKLAAAKAKAVGTVQAQRNRSALRVGIDTSVLATPIQVPLVISVNVTVSRVAANSFNQWISIGRKRTDCATVPWPTNDGILLLR